MLSRRAVLGHALAVPALIAVSRPALAAAPAVFARDGVALGGTDPVAYFLEGRALPGDPRNSVHWRGARWHFGSEANRVAFEMNPTAHAPRYGGYCAYALSQGALAPTVPEAWTIHDGALYLNSSLAVRQRWATDIPGYIALANGYWPGVLG